MDDGQVSKRNEEQVVEWQEGEGIKKGERCIKGKSLD